MSGVNHTYQKGHKFHYCLFIFNFRNNSRVIIDMLARPTLYLLNTEVIKGDLERKITSTA